MRGIDCRVWSWIVRMDVKTEGGACGEWTRMATRTTAESGYGCYCGLCQIPTGGRWLGAVVVTLERVGNCQGDGLHHLSRVHCPGSVMEYEAVKALCCGNSVHVHIHGYTLLIDRRTAWEKKNNKRAWVDWWRVRNGMGSDSWGVDRRRLPCPGWTTITLGMATITITIIITIITITILNN